MPYGAWITEPKLGLALSGGGHRAAFFHIGVLARLAELELLRPVRVISTVSSGSIVGALYYLHVKALLESTPAGAVTDGHYAEIVAKVARFCDEAQARNVRGRALLDYPHNFRLVTADFRQSHAEAFLACAR